MVNRGYAKRRGERSSLSFSVFFDKILIAGIAGTLFLFILYPVAGVLMRSLKWNGEWSLYHYRNLMTLRNLELIRNSVFVATFSSINATLLAFCIGVFAHFKKRFVRNAIYRSLMMTMISPPFISAIALLTLFGRRGLISYGVFGVTLNPYGWHGIVILQSLSGVSLSAIMMMTGLSQIDSRLFLAARDLGANPWSTLKEVVLPSMVPTVLSVFFLQFTMNISDFTTPIIIGGRYRVLATEAYLRVYAQANLNGAAAMTVLLLPPAIVAFYFYRRNMKRVHTLSERAKILEMESLNFKLPKGVQMLTGGVVAVFFLINAVQYGNLFFTAFTRNVSGTPVFTLDHFAVFQSRHVDALIRTIYMAVAAALLSTMIGVLLSYYHRRRQVKGFGVLEFVGSIPYIIPGIFFGLAYVVVFHRGPISLTGTLIILILNCTFRHISVGNKAANAAFETLDHKIEWASYDLGASKIGSLLKVTFPILRPTLLVSFINSFTASMTTVGPLLFLVSPRNLVTSVLMFNEVNSGRYGQSAVIGSALILITFSVNLMAIRLLSAERRRGK